MIQADCSLPKEILERLCSEGWEALPEAIRLLLNLTMLVERQEHLNAAPYERSEECQAHTNGFKEKTVQTRVGKLTLSVPQVPQVPQVREGGFYPQCLEKVLRSERALKLALAEMYVQGVSTRKVAAITEELCGFEVTSSQMSRAACELDGVMLLYQEG